jgi:hypothetical protein
MWAARTALAVGVVVAGSRRRHRTTNVWTKREGSWQIVATHTAFVLNAQQAAMLFGERT